MIYKSYIVENNLNILKEKMVLFYGENIGLISNIKKQIKTFYKNCEILSYDQDDVLKNTETVFSDVINISLFSQKKVYLISQASDKLLDFVEEILPKLEARNIFLFSGILEKKSKLRFFFETSNSCGIVPCYADNEIGIKKIIQERLKDFEGLTTKTINLILENSNLERIKLNNELEKIEQFFKDKKIDYDNLEILLDLKINEDFTVLRDAALLGDKIKTNKLLSDTVIEPEKNIFYLNSLNQRLSRLNEINNLDEKINIDTKISSLKPPIFWKDKPNFALQSKKWSRSKIEKVQKKTFEFEIQLKTNSMIDKNILFKKLIVDVCNLANS